jgi:hypothetical protein
MEFNGLKELCSRIEKYYIEEVEGKVIQFDVLQLIE